MSRAKEFEQRVTRIHRVLESDGCSVTWNDRIPDPDNPGQPRQIDILIKRGPQTVHVECRSHKSPQDVKWIEELMGRRISLGVDQIFAVSDSGFTEGAKRKAMRHGVILRDLQAITDAEVASWGEKTELEFSYYRVSNIQVQFDFSGRSPIPASIITYLVDNPAILSSLLNGSKYAINEIENKIFPLCIQLALEPSVPIEIDNCRVKHLKIRYEATEIRTKHQLPIVLAYASPEDGSTPDALVQSHGSIDVEIVKSPQRCSVHLDLSSIPPPSKDEIFAGIVHLTNLWALGVERVILVGNQELPTTVSTFNVIIPKT